MRHGNLPFGLMLTAVCPSTDSSSIRCSGRWRPEPCEPGDQLPTVRQVAVDLAINPNTVMRAYREMEIRGILDTQQGAGTFIAEQKEPAPKEERERQLAQLAGEFVSRAGLLGLTVEELMQALRDMSQERDGRRAETRRKS